MHETLRVCHVISTFKPSVGGVQRATDDLCGALASNGVKVVVLTRRFPGLPSSEVIANVPVYRLGYPGRSKICAFSFVIHVLWLMLSRLRDFRIVHVQNIDAPLLAGILCKVLLARYLVATIHGENKLELIRKRLFGVIRLRLAYKFTDKFVAISEPMREQLISDNVPSSQIHLIPNGIDTTIFHPPSMSQKQQARRQLNIPEPEVVFLYLGRLINTKRVDLLLHAWSQISLDQPRKLLIVGDGPERKALEKITVSLQLDSVKLEGATSNARCYYHAADVFVLPSQQEGLSVALLEAMATGLAVIVTSLPGNRQLIFHEENGLILPVDSLNALVKALRLLLQSIDLRKHLGQNAYASSANYSIRSVAKAHYLVYSDLQNQLARAHLENLKR